MTSKSTVRVQDRAHMMGLAIVSTEHYLAISLLAMTSAAFGIPYWEKVRMGLQK